MNIRDAMPEQVWVNPPANAGSCRVVLNDLADPSRGVMA